MPYTSAQLEGLRQGSSVVEGLVAWVDVVLLVVRNVVVDCIVVYSFVVSTELAVPADTTHLT